MRNCNAVCVQHRLCLNTLSYAFICSLQHVLLNSQYSMYDSKAEAGQMTVLYVCSSGTVNSMEGLKKAAMPLPERVASATLVI